MLVGEIIGVFRDVAIESQKRGLKDITDLILLDPFVGPALFFPGRTLTRADINRGVELIRQRRKPKEELSKFNEEYMADLARTILNMMNTNTGTVDLQERLAAVLRDSS